MQATKQILFTLLPEKIRYGEYFIREEQQLQDLNYWQNSFKKWTEKSLNHNTQRGRSWPRLSFSKIAVQFKNQNDN